eukprot:NODE_4423_length_663_cov_66.060261_g3775_i0.p1 GENE.NODE_4423_length_663_cov_66.060261_g3775_i0~~NODE_4423_length_663_cov_66.060261_g3775_i0.p1  ORF type:complete len:98 (+),score=16.10 NODE_4423_length_663_cov_66.060261_g3775_i0:267-560(+)
MADLAAEGMGVFSAYFETYDECYLNSALASMGKITQSLSGLFDAILSFVTNAFDLFGQGPSDDNYSNFIATYDDGTTTSDEDVGKYAGGAFALFLNY